MSFYDALRMIVSGAVGTSGFALLYRVNKKRLVFIAAGGGLTCLLYAVCCLKLENEFFQNLIPALFATAYSEVTARITKSPATQFVIGSIIPLVPGGKLYYTMYYFITGNRELFYVTVMQTLKIAAGLAVGIIVVSVVIHQINYNKFRDIYED